MTTEQATETTATNQYGIPLDPAIARDAVLSGAIKLTEDVDKVTSGVIIEAFAQTVKSKDKESGEDVIHYTTGKNDKGESLAVQPFAWTKVDSLAGAIELLEGELSDEQVAFIGQAFSGEANGKAVARLVDIVNSNSRSNARQNEYQRISNLYKPMDEEDKAKAVERMVTLYVQVFGGTREDARKKVLAGAM